MPDKLFVAALYVRVPLDEVPLEDWTPDDADDVSVGLVIEVGCEGEDGTTLFHARVATPKALEKAKPRPRTNTIISTRALIVMARYDREELQREVRSTVAWAARKATRDEGFEYLTRYYGWEFENHEVAE